MFIAGSFQSPLIRWKNHKEERNVLNDDNGRYSGHSGCTSAVTGDVAALLFGLAKMACLNEAMHNYAIKC
jgi:hypothetical protein